MQINELKNELKNPIIENWFVFCGEEDYLKKFYLSELRKKLVGDGPFSAFNHICLGGEKIDIAELADAIQAPPFMAEQKLIEWHYPNFNALKEAEIAELEELLSLRESYPQAVLVFIIAADAFDTGSAKKRSKLYTRLEKKIQITDFEKQTEPRLAEWIYKHFLREGITAGEAICYLMISRCGHSMSTLALEIDKIVCAMAARGRSVLEEKDIFELTCPTFEGDAFGLTNAILEGKEALAYESVRDSRLRKIDPTQTMGMVSKFFSDLLAVSAFKSQGLTPKEIAKKMKMHEYKASLYVAEAKKRTTAELARYVEICKEIDLSQKNGVQNGYIGLERLLAEIFSKEQKI